MDVNGFNARDADAEGALRARIHRGEVLALCDLFDQTGADCYARARRLVGEAHAKELVFRVFARMWANPPDPAFPIRSWLIAQLNLLIESTLASS